MSPLIRDVGRPVSIGVFLAILLAAFMNAAWNSAIKLGGGKIAVMTMTTFVGSVVSLFALPFIGIHASTDWRLLAFSIVIHTLYHFVLPLAYKHGDLGHVYPIARGWAPALVTLTAAAMVDELPPLIEIGGIVCLSMGVLAFAFQHRAQGGGHRGTVYAMATSVLIASYTVVDALGARRSDSALGFATLLTIGDGLATALVVLYWKGRIAFHVDRSTLYLSAVGGILQVGAYWIVVWALAQAPMGTVSALRESSVVFVALISAYLLKERFGWRRIACSALIFMGILLVKLGH